MKRSYTRDVPWGALSVYLCSGLIGTLFSTAGALPAQAGTSIEELAAEISALKADNQRMRSAINQMQAQQRHTNERIKKVAERKPEYVLPPPSPAIPVGATPAFVTADKKLQFGAITITPGGFIAAESVFRTRTTQTDATPFSAIPTRNSVLSTTDEYRLSARQSRISLLAQAPISSTMLVSGFAELDFLGAAHTANNVESDSYNPRIRNLYATLDNSAYGLHVLAGQSWTLATLNGQGITPRSELPPPTIDPQFVPGFVWARQPQIRVTKDFNQKFWAAISVEGEQTLFNGCTPGLSPFTNTAGTTSTPGTIAIPGAGTVTCQAFPQGPGGFFDTTTLYSLNHIPDVIGKVALDENMGGRDVHLEAYGMYRDLYDHVAYTSGGYSNKDTPGYGVGGSVLVAVVPKRLEFQASGLVGRGIGRYGTSTLPDATFAANGAPAAVPEAMFLGGFTAHVSPSIDVYAFGGFERQFAQYFSPDGGATFIGVGTPTAANAGCYTVGGACAGNTQVVWQVTGGMWDKLYKGNFGEVRAGLQYSYTKRQLFPSTTIAQNAATDDHVVWTSLRYYPFQ